MNIKEMRQQPRVIKSANSGFAGLLFLVVTAAFFVFTGTDFGREIENRWWIWLVMVLVWMPTAIWQYRYVVRVFNTGTIMEATVTDYKCDRHGCRVDLRYRVDDSTYTLVSRVHSDFLAGNWRHGETLKIVVDADKPKNAFLIEAYV